MTAFQYCGSCCMLHNSPLKFNCWMCQVTAVFRALENVDLEVNFFSLGKSHIHLDSCSNCRLDEVVFPTCNQLTDSSRWSRTWGTH